MTPLIRELFKPQFATQDPDIYATLLKTWQDFAEGHIRWPKAAVTPRDMPATVGILDAVKPYHSGSSLDSAASGGQ